MKGPLLQFPVGRAKALPKLRMGAITLPYPQTPSLGKEALSLCSDFETQRQAESSICFIHPELFFWNGVVRKEPVARADTRVQRISFRPLRLYHSNKGVRGHRS